ncbi:nuclear pore complex protein Nup205 [Bradysia coprophila]|uniref:nuclear pore complex protein Nup205 n=1 Tax=Bradysia coprophila TaxID=38358 RepID=UPI00187D84BC|nr:nuclear pore complex protein Nup205 [Bradysia coprophila]
MSEGTPDDLWTPCKHLNKVVDSFLSGKATEISTLELTLRKFKQNFINLLKNSPKNAKSREEIRQGSKDGVNIPGIGHTILSKDLVDESFIISDMYNLNEFMALELLCTAQQQIPHHPGLPRGLVAILLYYDGRKILVSSLKELCQAREGISWCVELSSEVTRLVTSYTDSLVADGLLNRIVDLLDTLDITKEMEILSENRALGSPKHHRQVISLFEEIRLQLASTLFCWSAQCGLKKDTTIKLINYLAKYKPNDARGGIDDVTLAALMALLYAFDLSVFQRREDGEEAVKRLPIVSESGFAQGVLDALYSNWECEELRSIALYAFGLAMATFRQAPQSLQQNVMSIIDQDEALVESAIQGKLFDFIYHVLLENESLYKTEFYFRRLHVLLTDFIELMHSKVTDLRARADETARTIQLHAQQGLDPPPNLCMNFETLLLIVGKLYSSDQLNLNLDLEYWGPMEIANNYQRTSTRSVSLFKFIRLAGELLPPNLFVPYIKMLAGLSSCQQSARNTFNLLKQGPGVSGSTTLSWDHFFESLNRYYLTLRQEQHPTTDTVYRVLNRSISPQEIAGLQAVLAVVRAVAKHDEVARIALCEHSSWQPLTIFLGLIGCSVVIPLKTELLLTLAALGKSKDTAMQLWINLEAKQIITTIPSTTEFAVRGIESEIEQIESRNGTYPLTQALLEFLYTISTTAVPKNLGAGTRKPGLDPYLTFVVETVFLRFYNRNYKNELEKWEVAEKCLKILEFYAQMYEVNPADFPVNGIVKEENPPPGFHILLQMNINDKSELLRLILHIIDEACVRLDNYAPFPGKAKLEKCTLYCLSIIEKALATQALFFDAHFAANCSILMSGTNKLLLGVNPRSGKPDNMLNITKFVTYNTWLPHQALLAVKILTFIARQPNVSTLLLGEFTRTTKLANEIRHGFVECLEADITVVDNSDPDHRDNVHLTLKDTIINLLEECLPQSAPNIAHYLFGFDISKDIRATRLQQPGVLDFPSNCIKSLVTILDEALENRKSGFDMASTYSRLIQNAYHLLHSLCYNSKTSDVVLRFLRSCNDFFCRHIAAMPFRSTENGYALNQMTGLLKSLAIELKITANNCQVTQFTNMSKLLLGVVQDSCQDGKPANDMAQYHSIANNSTQYGDNSSIFLSNNNTNRNEQSAGLLICKLLERCDFEVKFVDQPKWDFFDNSRIAQLLQSCEFSTGSGPKLINIKKLHEILRDELSTVPTTIASGQRQLILQEIEAMMKYALSVNEQKNLSAASSNFLEAWGMVIETLFIVAPAFILSYEVQRGLILEILQVLLNKIVPLQIMPELSNLASASVLQLLVILRHCYTQLNSGTDFANSSEPISGISFSLLGSNHLLGQFAQTSYSAKTNSLSLKYILKNIVEWILISGVSSQKLKVNLYAALLNFMQIIKLKQRKSDSEVCGEDYVSRLDKSISKATAHSDYEDNVNDSQMAAEVFASVGDKIIDILCHDCTTGHDVCKMLALSCIDILLEMDMMVNYIQFISRRGYLAHLVDSLMKTDNQLCRILETMPDNMKALYVYESKMAILGRVASVHIGAELLLEHKTLNVLSSMKVYDMHPDFQVNQYQIDNSSSFIPPVEIRYQQILLAALNICDVVLSTLGPENQSAITQVLHFLYSHGDMIEIVLRTGTPFLNVCLLQELSAITGLIARTANQEMLLAESNTPHQELGAYLYRLQKLMMSLFPRFILSEASFKEINKADSTIYQTADSDRSQNIKYFLQIASNLALYARNAIANHSADHRTTGILFSPSVNEGLQRNETQSGSLEILPSIGIVVNQLKASVEYFNRVKQSYDALVQQRNSLPTLCLDSKNQSQYDRITEMLSNKRTELNLCIFLTEHCLYLLWTHCDFYMLRAISVNSIQMNSIGRKTIISPIDAGWKITSDDIAVLRKSLIQVFNETFCQRLVAMEQNDSVSCKGFVEALLRRIKRLITFVPV